VLAFNGGELQVGCGHLSLDEQLAPGGADTDEGSGAGLGFDESGAGARKAGSCQAGSGGRGGWKRNGRLLACQRSPSLHDPGSYTRADKCVIGGR
jgi:hypothetical protein